MNTQASTGWGSRSKRTTVIALGLVAVIAGVAVAYFLTSQKFAGNKALGGTLTVDATLPMDFTDETLYPTSPDPAGPTLTGDTADYIDEEINGAPESNWSYAEKEFTIDNNNPVDVTYELYATCEECIPDPADTEEAAAARADKADQFNNLFVRIYKPGETCTIPAVDLTCSASESEVHSGKLSEMTADNPAQLGNIPDGEEVTYTVRLWLQNDETRAQPQGVQNIWEFFVNAKTPA